MDKQAYRVVTSDVNEMNPQTPQENTNPDGACGYFALGDGNGRLSVSDKQKLHGI